MDYEDCLMGWQLKWVDTEGFERVHLYGTVEPDKSNHLWYTRR